MFWINPKGPTTVFWTRAKVHYSWPMLSRRPVETAAKKAWGTLRPPPCIIPSYHRLHDNFFPFLCIPFQPFFWILVFTLKKKRVFSKPSGKGLFTRFFVLWVRDLVLIKRILILKLCRSNMSQKSKSLVKTRSLEKVWGP